MKETDGYTEMISHGTSVDAAACATTFVLDAVVGKKFTHDTFDAYLRTFGYASETVGNGGQSIQVAQPAIETAVHYMNTFYFDRLKDIEEQLKHRRFQDAYQLPWSIFAKALMQERRQRYEALSMSSLAIHRSKACEMPILMPSVVQIPPELSDSVDMLVEESVALLRRGDLSGVVIAVEDCLKGEFAYPVEPPSPIRKGNVIRVDFQRLVIERPAFIEAHNNGLIGAVRDLYLLQDDLVLSRS